MLCQLFHLPTLNMNPKLTNMLITKISGLEDKLVQKSLQNKICTYQHSLYQPDGSCFAKWVTKNNYSFMLQNACSLPPKKKSKTQIVKQNKPLAYMNKSTVLYVKGTFWEPF